MGASPGFIKNQEPTADQWNGYFAAKADDPGVPSSYQQPTTGATLTATRALGSFIIDPAAELAALTVVLPPLAINDQVFEITTTQVIDAMTVNPAAGQTVFGGAVGTMSANSGASWRYRLANTTWYRRF